MDIALGVVFAPVGILVVAGIKVQEVGEEAARGDLAGEQVEVVVGIRGEVADAALLLPDLDGEDGSDTAAHTFVRGVQDFADNAAAFCARVCTVIDRREYNLIATAAVDGVHVMDECLHGLMHATHGFVHRVLDDALLALQAVEVLLQVIFQFHLIKMTVISTV